MSKYKIEEGEIYDINEDIHLPDGTKARYLGVDRIEGEEKYVVEQDFFYAVHYDKEDIDLLNIGMPYMTAKQYRKKCEEERETQEWWN